MKFANMRAAVQLGLCALGLGLGTPALRAQEGLTAERPPIIPTSAFAKRSPFRSPLLSPDGSKIALIATIGGKTNILAMNSEDNSPVYRLAMEDDSELDWISWAGNNRILFAVGGTDRVYGVEVRYTRLFSLDLTTRQASYIGPKDKGIVGDDVLYVDPDGEYVLLAITRNLTDEPEVWHFPLAEDRLKDSERIVRRKTGVWQWEADNEGIVRLGLGWNNGRLSVRYRSDGDEDFRLIDRFKEEDEGRDEIWSEFKILAGTDEGYVLEPGTSGKLALRRFNFATRQVGEIIQENGDWDIHRASINPEGEPIAAYYTDDIEHVIWLDPAKQNLQEQLQAALGRDDVWIGSRSLDDSRMLVWVSGPTLPGAAFIYFADRKELRLFGALRPELDAKQLAPVRPVNYTARDGTVIRAYLTLPKGREPKGLPLIIMPHGGPYGVRDLLEYNDEVQLLANRGYAVLQPNYRGSSGYGRSFSRLGRGQIGRAMQDDLDDAMDWAVEEGIADPTRVCLVGASYGGYAALWGATRNPERYRCAASFAGVTDWDALLDYDKGFLSRYSGKAWRRRVEGEDDFDLDSVSPANQAVRLTRPVLIAQGKEDTRVPFSQYRKMRKALENAGFDQAEYLEFEEAGHGFDREEDEQLWYDRLLAFLAKHNPAD